MQFGMMMHFEPIDLPDRQKFEILQIQDGGGRHLENRKIAISQLDTGTVFCYYAHSSIMDL